jgi:hypothetical protein
MAEKIISPGVFSRENDKSLVQRGTSQIGAVLIGPTVKGNPLIPTEVTSYSEYSSLFGETFKSGSNYYEYFTSLAAREYFNSGGKSLIVTPIISGSNSNTFASANVYNSAATASVAFAIETLAWGSTMNNSGSVISGSTALVSGSSDNVRWEITDVDSTTGVFTLVVRRGDDSNTNKNILETWSNLSLDPQQSNYISRVIGDEKQYFDSSLGAIKISGEFGNNSQFIRVQPGSVINTVDSIDNLGNFKSGSYSTFLPTIGSGSLNGSFSGGIASTNLPALCFENISLSNIQGFPAQSYIDAVTVLSNKDEFDFNLVLAPGVTLEHDAADNIIGLCEGRGDSMVVIDGKLYGATPTQAATAAAASNSNYAAAYYPWVQVYSSNLGKSVWVPASVVMGGVYAFNDQVGAEWFAPAGLNRGGIGSVIRAERKLSQTDRDLLYSKNINPLATFPGEGVVAWGQKTLQKRATALDRVGVRRLLIVVKRFLGQTGRSLTFEQNTAVNRNRFLSVAEPYLESIVQRQGLYAYKIVMDDSNNSADVIDRNQIVGQIYLQPTRTAEFIILDFTVNPTGAVFPS